MAKRKGDAPKAARERPERGEYRGIYVAMIDSPEYEDLSEEAAACLWPLKLKLGQAGIAVFAIESLPRYTKMSSERVSRGLRELRDKEWLKVEGNVFWGRNFLRWDPLRPLAQPNMRKAIEAHIKTLPKLKIVNDFADYYGLAKPFDKVNPSRTHREPIDKGTGNPSRPRNTEYVIRNTEDEVTLPASVSPSSDLTPSLSAASAEGHDDNSSQFSNVDNSGEHEVSARHEMATMLDAYSATLEPLKQRAFTAVNSGLVDGSDLAAWHDKNGEQVPWKERPRLMKLALAQVKAKPSQSLRSALRYVIPQQLDPFPTRASNAPPADSEAGRVRNEQPTSKDAVVELPIDVHVKRMDDDRAKRREAENQVVAEFEAMYSIEAEQLLQNARKDFADLQIPDEKKAFMVQSAYRKAVLAITKSKTQKAGA